MDEWLLDRVNQLKEIEDRVNSIRRAAGFGSTQTGTALAALQDDIRKMIERAEADYADF